MADIYSRARFVMAWLGPQEDVTGKGLDFLAQADRLFNIHCLDIAGIGNFHLSCYQEMGQQTCH